MAQGSLTVGLGYDAAGRRTSLTYPNGTNTSYTYDNASRLLTITHNGPSGVIESLTYTYDAAGNRTSLNRANGTASLLPSAVASASYDAANQQTQFGGVIHTFDANGNLTNDGTNTYTWDVRDRLIGISGGTTANFSYDPYDRRVSTTINGAVFAYLYDASDIIKELGSGAIGASYLRSLDIDEPFVRQTAAGTSIIMPMRLAQSRRPPMVVALLWPHTATKRLGKPSSLAHRQTQSNSRAERMMALASITTERDTIVQCSTASLAKTPRTSSEMILIPTRTP